MDEFGRDVYKLVKQFNVMARKERDTEDMKDELSSKSKKQDEEVKIFPPLKVAQTVQQQIRDFKVSLIASLFHPESSPRNCLFLCN